MNKQKKTDSSRAAVHQNDDFGSSLGFVLTCTGSAVGMDSIWMFPYHAGRYDGGAFLVPYILFIVLSGLAGLSAEFAIRRRAKTGTPGAYEYCWEKIRKGRLGYFLAQVPLLGSLGIAIGYTIIVGWVIKALADSVIGAILIAGAATYFSQAIDEFGSIPQHVLVVVTVASILMFGATKGAKKINKVPMPSFFILFAILAIRVAFLPGAGEGHEFLFTSDWSDLLKVNTWAVAMGQAFFSLSIAGSGMIMYGTYLAKTEDIPKVSIRAAFSDTVATMMAALTIMPVAFASGIEPNAGPPLTFITLPKIFRQMPMGRLLVVVFFLSVAFTDITNLISMFEAISESWRSRFKLPRKTAVALCSDITLLVGIFLESEPKVESWMDFIAATVVPFGAVLGAVPTYYILGYKEIRGELEERREKPLGELFGPLAGCIYVPLAVIVFILGVIYDGIG